MKNLIIIILIVLTSCSEKYKTERVLKANLTSNFKENCISNKIESYPIDAKDSKLNFRKIEEIATGYPTTKEKLIKTFENYKNNQNVFKANDFINTNNVFDEENINYDTFLKIFTPIVFNKDFYIIPYKEYIKNGIKTHFFVKKGEEEFSIIDFSFECF